MSIKEQIVGAGLAEARNAFQERRILRPYAAIYSSAGGLRPVQLNDNERQASDSDVNLLMESIRALSDNPDLEAFAVFGLVEDLQGKRWFAVHYESRNGQAELRQYPLPPPDDLETWIPARVEDSAPVVF